MTETAQILSQCPYCAKGVIIEQNWTAGGVNDYGGWVLKCSKCEKPFDARVGRDIQMSRVVSGAAILESYDDEVSGDKDRVLNKYGLGQKPNQGKKRRLSATPKRKKAKKRSAKKSTKRKHR
jgi:hypothetical protein